VAIFLAIEMKSLRLGGSAARKIFDHGQYRRRRADLQVRRDLGQVRLTDDHVQPAVPVRIGVRLVPWC
jgi:hypothetical protein